MSEFNSSGQEAAALQRLLEASHSLQVRIFRLALRRRLNVLAVDELAANVQAFADTLIDLRELTE